MRIAVYFKTKEQQDETVRLGRNTPGMRKFIRWGRTPKESREANEWRLAADEKNGQLTAEDRKLYTFRLRKDAVSRVVTVVRVSLDDAKKEDEENKRKYAARWGQSSRSNP